MTWRRNQAAKAATAGSPPLNKQGRAMLEGYRAGQQAQQGNSRRAPTGGPLVVPPVGAPKAASPPARAGKPTPQQCKRHTCPAGRNQQPTLGGGSCCHRCKKPFNQTVRLEELAEWAFELRLQEEKEKADKDVSPGKKAAATEPPPVELRKQRQEQLKAAEAGKPLLHSRPPRKWHRSSLGQR